MLAGTDMKAGDPGRRRDIIVIGASAGGIETLIRLVRGLPADLPATVLVAAPIQGNSTQRLPALLSGEGALPAVHVWGREPIRHGVIYVAAPDFHLIIKDGEATADHGPREGGFRPAVDALFRTAATTFGERVVGVVLSGVLDGGTAGLRAIKERGGLAVVQNPDEAIVGDMPRNAIENTAVDYVLSVAEIAPLLTYLAGGAPAPAQPPPPGPVPWPRRTGEHAERGERGEREWETRRLAAPREGERLVAGAPSGEPTGEPSCYRCPECGAVLFETPDSDEPSDASPEGGILRFQCLAGHGWSGPSLEMYQGQLSEEHLWVALGCLYERARLASRLAAQADARGFIRVAERLRERAARADARARRVREMLDEFGWDHEPIYEEPALAGRDGTPPSR